MRKLTPPRSRPNGANNGALTVNLGELPKRQGHISGAWRQVHNEDIDMRPGDVKQQLLNSLLDHEAAPYDRRSTRHEEAHAHAGDSVVR